MNDTPARHPGGRTCSAFVLRWFGPAIFYWVLSLAMPRRRKADRG